MVCSSVQVLAHAHNAKLSIQNNISQDLNDSSNYMEQHSTNNVTTNFAVFPYDKETQNVQKNLTHKTEIWNATKFNLIYSYVQTTTFSTNNPYPNPNPKNNI